MVTAHTLERVMRLSAGPHVVLGVHFEEATLVSLGQDCRQVLVLEARTGETPDRVRRKAERDRVLETAVLIIAFMAFLRFPALAAWRSNQTLQRAVRHRWQDDVRAGAALHELPGLVWKSTVDVPWQVVPGPAAQSFWPLRATPKHFSL